MRKGTGVRESSSSHEESPPPLPGEESSVKRHYQGHFTRNKNPSCIDLVITDQPNLVLDSGTRASLDSFCHHQITYCRVNFNIPPPPLLKERSGIITGLTQPFLRGACLFILGNNILVLTRIQIGKLKRLPKYS